MRFFQWLLRTPRALGALMLLATLVGGEVADAHHHLVPESCGTEQHGGREDNCTCAALHAVTIGIEPVASPAPQVSEREYTPAATAAAPRTPRGAQSSPRAPPRG